MVTKTTALGLPTAILAAERRRLEALVPSGELTLTGGSSLPGAVTKGDVDLHLRVPHERFAEAVEALKSTYRVAVPEIWTDELATFEVPDAPAPTGLALTAIGAEHDRRFRRTWQLLSAQPGLLAAYNEMKLSNLEADEDTYRRAKSDFFARLLTEGDQGDG